MYEVFADAFRDSLQMVPLLLLIYIGIELVEYKFGDKLILLVQKAGMAGPIMGAVTGSLPQCGISVVATALYTQRLVTIGTLLAVYLATSDEAIPIILSRPDTAGLLWPLIVTKILIALVAGYLLDLLFRKTNAGVLEHVRICALGKDDVSHHHETVRDEQACCGHYTNPEAEKFNPREIFLHPLIHTAKIFAFIFIISLVINGAVFHLGEEAFGKLFAGQSFFQPLLAALVGLIPNCAASVAITELYLKGAITYGSLIAGLCASAGLGILVLFREEKGKKEVFKIIGILFGISVLAGQVIQTFSEM